MRPPRLTQTSPSNQIPRSNFFLIASSVCPDSSANFSMVMYSITAAHPRDEG